LNEDFFDILAALAAQHCRFLVVGAHAMAVHGVPRATGHIDIWIESDPENARRAWQALVEFGAPVDSLKASESDLTTPNTVIQIGLPPRRVDRNISINPGGVVRYGTVGGRDAALSSVQGCIHRVSRNALPHPDARTF